MFTEVDHYQVITEVKQVVCGRWKAVVFLLKLVVLLYSCLDHLAEAVADGSDDDTTQVLPLVRDTHPSYWSLNSNTVTAEPDRSIASFPGLQSQLTAKAP